MQEDPKKSQKMFGNPRRFQKILGNSTKFQKISSLVTLSVAYYLELGMGIDACDNAGFTPLHEAVTKGHYDCVKLLLEQGSNPNCQSSDGTRYFFTLIILGKKIVLFYCMILYCLKLYADLVFISGLELEKKGLFQGFLEKSGLSLEKKVLLGF